MTASELVGTWKLKTFEIEDPQGKVSAWGENPTGVLIYSTEGFMSVAINAEPEGDPEDPGIIFDSMLFYAGRFELKNAGTLVHHVTNASDRSRIGQEMVREVSMKGRELWVVGRGGYGVSRLIWERIS